MTTLDRNIGDDFIRQGIFSFFSEIFDHFEPLYINKHDLSTLFNRWGDESIIVSDKFKDAEIIVQAGTPVYWNIQGSACHSVTWAEELWEKRIFRLGSEKPVFNIGAGSCQPYPGSSKDVAGDSKCEVFIRNMHEACCWTSVRDPLASDILASLGLPHASLPCPAFHASRCCQFPQAGNENNILAINLMRLGGHYRLKEDVSEQRWIKVIEKLLPRLRKYHHLLFVAHDVKEKEFMKRWSSGSEHVFYSSRWRDYLPVYSCCIGAVTNRVHGAVCAAGFGHPSVIVGNDTRLQIGEFIGIPSRYVATVSVEEIIDLIETGIRNHSSEKERLLALREDSAGKYRRAIEKGIDEFQQNRGEAPYHVATRYYPRIRNPRLDECRNILFPRFDTFGDIVLLQGLLSALLDLLPEVRITLLVREDYVQLAALFSSRLAWKTTRINPYKEAPDPEEASSLLEELSADSYDLVLCTTYNRTWLDDLVAANLSSARRVAIGNYPEMPGLFIKNLDRVVAENGSSPYDTVVRVEENSHETRKYQALWEVLTGDDKLLPSPQLAIPADAETAAEKVLTGIGLNNKAFYFCCPAGSANVSLKNWPENNFARVIAELEKKYKLRALVVGHESEKDIVDKVVRKARQYDARPKVWLGKDGDIPLACALAQKAFFYLGNDTGLMHMAAALDKPVFAIFGGGTWPRFLPDARRGRAFVMPMVCFYCKWDCFFDEALCVNSIPFQTVLTEIQRVLSIGFNQDRSFKVVEIPPRKKDIKDALEKAVLSIKRLKSERVSLDEQVNDLTRLLEKSEADREARLEQVKDLTGRLKESEADRSERLKQIEELTGQIEESNKDRALRLDQVKDLTRLLKESEADREARLEQVKDLTGRLKESEADRAERFRQIEELTAWLKESEADRRVRLKVIEDQQIDIEALTAQLVQESQKAQAALEGWKSLEETFAVRYGRKMGLIKAKELDVSESQAENDAENEKESLD